MSDQDYFVSNALTYMVEDLNSDEGYVRKAESGYRAEARNDDLIDNYVRPYIANRPQDFPQSIGDL